MKEITMSEQRLQLAFLAFTIVGIVFGYVMGRVHEMHQTENPKQRLPRRSPEQRHTRSHW